MILLTTAEFQQKFLDHYGKTEYEDGLGSMINIEILSRKEYAYEVLNRELGSKDIDEVLDLVRDEINFKNLLDLPN